MFKQHDIVKTTVDLQVKNVTLKAGAIGNIVEIYAEGAAYEVEFNGDVELVSSEFLELEK